MEGVRNVLKVSELNNSVKERAYQDSLHEKYQVWRGGVKSVEKEWKKFQDIVMECTNDVCSMRREGGQRRGVNGGMKKWVGRWPKREELLRNGFREEIVLPMTDTRHREWQ